MPAHTDPRPAAPARGLTRLLLAMLGTLALVLGAPAAALAHDRLLSSDPADGATLETAPQQITLTFSDAPLDVSPQVRITGEDGTVLVDGAPAIDGTTATMPLPDGLPAGHASVQWRVVSVDGHPIEGELGFDVVQGTPPSAEESTSPTTSATAADEQPTSTAPSAAASPAASEGSGGLGPLAIAVIAVPVLALIVVGAVLMRRRRP